MAKITMAKKRQEDCTGERTPTSDVDSADVDSAEVESTRENLSPIESKIEQMQEVLDALKEEYGHLGAYMKGIENSLLEVAGDGQDTHFDAEDSEVMDDSDLPEMSGEEVLGAMTAEIKEYREEIVWMKHAIEMRSKLEFYKHTPPKNESPVDVSSEPTTQATFHAVEAAPSIVDPDRGTSVPVPSTTADGKPIITCLKDLCVHPKGAPIHTIDDLPWIIRYRLKSKDMEQHKWQNHPLVQEERMRRHVWRLQNDATGEYSALGFQQAERMPDERDQRFALLKEAEQAEAALQAAIAAMDEPDRLTEQQMQAIAALRDGNSFQETGVKLSVDDATLEGWQKNPNFEAELTYSIEEKMASVRHMALTLADQAIRCVEESVKTDRCPKSALAVLRAIGAMNRQVTQSGLSPHVVNAESGEPAEDENGCESATWKDSRALENEIGLESATYGNERANKNQNRFESATWCWEAEVPRVVTADLPDNQRCGVDSLLAGKLIEDVAINSGATVADVRQWLQTDRLFQSALNCKFRDKVRHLYCRLLALAETSCEIIYEALSSGQVKIAIRYLRGLALM